MNSQERIDEIRKRAAHRQSFYHTLDATLRQSTDDINYLIDKIEAQQQEIDMKKIHIELLQQGNKNYQEYAKSLEQQIDALVADKDEQARRIMQYDTVLRRVREALDSARGYTQYSADIRAKEAIESIDALLGGAEDDGYPCTDKNCYDRGNYHTGCEECPKHKGGAEDSGCNANQSDG